MNDYKEQLTKIETTVNNRKLELAKIDQQKTTAKDDETKLLTELKGYGFNDITKLPGEIETKDKKISGELNELNTKLGI